MGNKTFYWDGLSVLVSDQVVWLRVLAWDIVPCSLATQFTLIMLSPPRCLNGYWLNLVPRVSHLTAWGKRETLGTRLVLANLMLEVTLRWKTSQPGRGGVEILLVTSWYRNQNKLRPDGPLGL